MRSEGYGTCLSVCVSVYAYSRTMGNEAAHERLIPTASVGCALEK